MAATRTRGCKGVVYIKDLAASGAATQVFGVSQWQTVEAADEDEASEIGNCEKIFIPGAVETNLTLNLWWDPGAGANQSPLAISNEIEFEIYPGGATSGQTVYSSPTGGAVVLNVDRQGGNEGAVASVIQLKVNGRLSESVVP